MGGRTLRDTRSLRDVSRSSHSRLMRTRRTRSACLSWPPSYSRRSRLTRSRSRKLRRSLRSTWPSSGRLSKSWRRLRNVPSLLRLRFVINDMFKTLTLVQDSYKAPYLLSWPRISSINSEFKAVSTFTTLQTHKTQKKSKNYLRNPLHSSLGLQELVNKHRSSGVLLGHPLYSL